MPSYFEGSTRLLFGRNNFTKAIRYTCKYLTINCCLYHWNIVVHQLATWLAGPIKDLLWWEQNPSCLLKSIYLCRMLEIQTVALIVGGRWESLKFRIPNYQWSTKGQKYTSYICSSLSYMSGLLRDHVSLSWLNTLKLILQFGWILNNYTYSEK